MRWRYVGGLEKTEKHTKRLEYSAEIIGADCLFARQSQYTYYMFIAKYYDKVCKKKKKNIYIYIYIFFFGLLSQCSVTRLIGVLYLPL